MYNCNKCIHSHDCKSREAFSRLAEIDPTGDCSGYEPRDVELENPIRDRGMSFTEVRHRIIRALPDNFLEDDGNRMAFSIMAKALEQLERQEDYFEKMFGKTTSKIK